MIISVSRAAGPVHDVADVSNDYRRPRSVRGCLRDLSARCRPRLHPRRRGMGGPQRSFVVGRGPRASSGAGGTIPANSVAVFRDRTARLRNGTHVLRLDELCVAPRLCDRRRRPGKGVVSLEWGGHHCWCTLGVELARHQFCGVVDQRAVRHCCWCCLPRSAPRHSCVDGGGLPASWRAGRCFQKKKASFFRRRSSDGRRSRRGRSRGRC